MLESKGLEGMAGSWEEKVSMILTRNVRYALTIGWNNFCKSISAKCKNLLSFKIKQNSDLFSFEQYCQKKDWAHVPCFLK